MKKRTLTKFGKGLTFCRTLACIIYLCLGASQKSEFSLCSLSSFDRLSLATVEGWLKFGFTTLSMELNLTMVKPQ